MNVNTSDFILAAGSCFALTRSDKIVNLATSLYSVAFLRPEVSHA